MADFSAPTYAMLMGGQKKLSDRVTKLEQGGGGGGGKSIVMAKPLSLQVDEPTVLKTDILTEE